jgi:cytochrome c553
MLGAGMLPSGKPVITRNITAAPKGPTFAFGEYILSYQDCRECHGRHLTGGAPGQMVPPLRDLHRTNFGRFRRTFHRFESENSDAMRTLLRP